MVTAIPIASWNCGESKKATIRKQSTSLRARMMMGQYLMPEAVCVCVCVCVRACVCGARVQAHFDDAYDMPFTRSCFRSYCKESPRRWSCA